ncbi:hypothetical protein AMTR_s00011p00196030 [Amborella trichopoda]|uniref:Uncharacterized protein n=1 Tax=Amborella trichopoda TaxID=13333 RepID=W1NHG9_AMBTC|nr:hypothetical protein AMTR_s00011p00196030 [Amborella trichopoda]
MVCRGIKKVGIGEQKRVSFLEAERVAQMQEKGGHHSEVRVSFHGASRAMRELCPPANTRDEANA